MHSDKNLRRICGWENTGKKFPAKQLSQELWQTFAGNPTTAACACSSNQEGLRRYRNDRNAQLTGFNGHRSERKTDEENKCIIDRARDSKSEKRRGRPKKGEEKPPKEPTRIEKQQTMSLEEMLKDLPKVCDIGTKKNSKGHVEHWIGYKLHLDTADGCVPISAILTSASVHDSQVAIPLAEMTARRVINCYDLMDAAYDVPGIIAHSKSLGHVPLIDKNPRRDKALADELKAESKRQKLLNWEPAEKARYNERTTAERANARLKDEFGGRMIRVRGDAKVMCHLMFGVLVLSCRSVHKVL